MVELTNSGRAQVDALKLTVNDFREQGWQGLSDHDYQQLHRIMTTIVHNFGIENAEVLSTATSLSPAEVA